MGTGFRLDDTECLVPLVSHTFTFSQDGGTTSAEDRLFGLRRKPPLRRPFVVRPASDSRIVPLIAHRPGKLERRAARMRAKGEQLEFDFLRREK